MRAAHPVLLVLGSPPPAHSQNPNADSQQLTKSDSQQICRRLTGDFLRLTGNLSGSQMQGPSGAAQASGKISLRS
ncbi:uncharacterized protein V1510DRAFT_247180 [Dipodascopsis tothii]|uniref:uncharacterized protein n=1 Tax=Dipodascopsis tothii TaxID=44089 RepID=UPI0034CD0AB2